jgi:hypothetical protein
MKTIIVKTQAELDALPDSFSEFTIIEIRSDPGVWISVTKARGSSHVVAWGSSHVEAWGSSHVEAWGSSHVEAWGSSHVVAWGSSHVVARESSHVEAWGSSHVEAWGSSHVVAWGSSHVVARESSSVVAWESSSVVAWESSRVEAWGSSRVVAWENVSVHVQSEFSNVDLMGFAVAMVLAVGSKLVSAKSKTATIIRPPEPEWTVDGWLDRHGVKKTKGAVILFKRASKDFKTQEGTPNETLWTPGTAQDHPAWEPSSRECGAGKFHACPRPYFCDEFRSDPDDVYVAIEVKVKDLACWPRPEYPHKIAFRSGKILHVCNRFGEEVKA